MLISHRKSFIYTKTVKTGGTSVESYFEPFCMKPDTWEFSHGRKEHISEHGIIGARTSSPIEIQNSIWFNHMPAQTIKGLVDDEVWDNYFKFCIVRNPFEQLVSAYHFFPISQRTSITNVGELQSDFENWLRIFPIPLGQNKYMINGKFCMDYVIKFEALLDGVKVVCDKLDIQFNPEKLLHLKQSKKPEIGLQNYFSSSSLNIVKNDYAFELDKFEYSTPW